MTRRAYPYFLVSLGVHLALLLTLVLLKGPQVPEIRQRRVVVELSRRRELPERPQTGRQPTPPGAPAPDTRPAAGSLDLSGPRTLAVPVGPAPEQTPPARSRPVEVGRAALASAPRPEAAVAPAPQVRVAAPSPEEILADMPVPGAAAGRQDAVGRDSPVRGYPDAGALEWGGRERKVLKAARPEFPQVLVREAQEVDVEAAFWVARSGQVTRVEITGSSGYSTVDRAVERALFNYLFEPSPVEQEDTGRIRFRFRLERMN